MYRKLYSKKTLVTYLISNSKKHRGKLRHRREERCKDVGVTQNWVQVLLCFTAEWAGASCLMSLILYEEGVWGFGADRLQGLHRHQGQRRTLATRQETGCLLRFSLTAGSCCWLLREPSLEALCPLSPVVFLPCIHVVPPAVLPFHSWHSA